MRRVWRPVLDGITPYDAGKPLEALMGELGLTELVRLSANENPLGPSPRVVEAIRREAERVHLYPDGGSLALREALGRRLGVSPAQIVVGNGADELIALVALAAFDPGDEIVVPTPSFEPYATAVTMAGAQRPRESDGRLRDGPGRRAPPGDAAHEGRHPVLAAQSGHDDHPPGAAAPAAGGARRRSSARGPRRGVSRLLRRPRVPGRRAAARPLPAADRAAHVLEDRRAGRPAGRLRRRQPGVDRPVQPRARALQRQPPGAGGGAGVAGRSRARAAHADAGAARSARSSRASSRGWGSPSRPRRPTSSS